jgi:cytidyltransferase-like protein
MNIWVNGCFDLLHTGHIDLLWFAKLYGTSDDEILPVIRQNKLFVGLDGDERVMQLKGKNRPINDIETRKKIIENLKMVDKVVIFNTSNELRNYIKVFNIDYVIVGDHYRNKEVIGAENAKYGAAFYPVNDKSTTNIINKIKKI